MKHKMFLTVTAVIMLLHMLIASSIQSAEITIDWRQKLDSGLVDDLHFMPGQEQFILSSGQVQLFTEIRLCDDGRILQSYPLGGYQFEFTPDSTKLIFISGRHSERGYIHLRNLSDMSLLAQYQLPKDEELPHSFYRQFAVDPVRPLIYAIWERTNDQPSGITKLKILIYNSETLLPVGELSTDADSGLKFSEIAVSKDGKYLAAINYGDSKLTVWSLDTRQKIVDKFISDQNTGKFSEPADIKFSELNTDIIFFTGQFYRKNNEELTGLCIYSIKENRIIDSTFAIQPNSIGGNPKIYLFENETKFIASNGVYLNVLNLIEKKIELKKDILGVNRMALGNFNYHNFEKYFIGGGGELIDKFNYKPNTSVPTENPKETIYPNPTSGIVNIPMNCANASKYEIYNTTGRLLYSTEITGATNNLLTIDFSQYPAGMYSIKVYCGKQISQYQVLKEG